MACRRNSPGTRESCRRWPVPLNHNKKALARNVPDEGSRFKALAAEERLATSFSKLSVVEAEGYFLGIAGLQRDGLLLGDKLTVAPENRLKNGAGPQ